MSRRRWAIGVSGIVVAVVACGIAAVAVSRARHADATTRTSAPVSTAVVTRKNLVVTASENGALGYEGAHPVVAAGSGMVTWLPAVGQTIGLGQPVYQVNGKPVPLWHGETPLWRPLKSGMDKGADVREVEQNLKTLGYFSGTPDDTFTAATATAIKKWQKDLGLTQTGVLDPGCVVLLPSDSRVTKVDGILGAPAQGKLIEVSGTGRVITVKMPVTKLDQAPVGAEVTIELPNGSHTTGKISSVGTVATTPDSQGGAGSSKIPTVDLLITPSDAGAVGKLDGAPVTVAFVSQRKDNVLTVPVGALLALAEGGYAVEGTDGHLIKIDLGLFASGDVEASGEGLHEGLTIKVAGR